MITTIGFELVEEEAKNGVRPRSRIEDMSRDRTHKPIMRCEGTCIRTDGIDGKGAPSEGSIGSYGRPGRSRAVLISSLLRDKKSLSSMAIIIVESAQDSKK